jgi:hypothetical protein
VKLVAIMKMLCPEIHYQRISRGQAIFEIRIDLKLLKLPVVAEWLDVTGAGKDMSGLEVGSVDDDLPCCASCVHAPALANRGLRPLPNERRTARKHEWERLTIQTVSSASGRGG